MAPHNSHWEAQIEDYRKNRRLLVARNIDFKATRATFEADVRAKLTKPGSVIFLWPPPSSAQYSNPNRHSGWVMLAFNQRPDARTAEVDLKDYVFRNRPIRIDRAMRVSLRIYSSLSLPLVNANHSIPQAPRGRGRPPLPPQLLSLPLPP